MRMQFKSRMFKHLVVRTCCMMLLPVALVSLIFYCVYYQNITNSTLEETQYALRLAQERLHRRMEQVEQQAMHLATNITNNTVRHSGEPMQGVDYMSLLEHMQLTMNLNDAIEAVSLYDPDRSVCLDTSWGYILSPNFPYWEDVRTAASIQQSTGWFLQENALHNGYITYIQRLPVNLSVRQNQVLLIQVSKEMIYQELKVLETSGGESTLLWVHGQGEVFFSSGPESPLAQEVFQHSAGKKGSGMLKLAGSQGERLLCYYAFFPDGGFLALLRPESYVYAALYAFRGFMCLLVFLMLLLIAASSILYSDTVYRPIGQLMQFTRKLSQSANRETPAPENMEEIEQVTGLLDFYDRQLKNMSETIDRANAEMKPRFLNQIIEDSVHKPSIQKYLQYYAIPKAGGYGTFAVAVHWQGSDSFRANERSIALYAVQNIMLELLNEHFKLEGDVVDRGGGCLAVVLYLASCEDNEKQLREYAMMAADVVRATLGIPLSIGIGRVYGSILDLSLSYNEAFLALMNISGDRMVQFFTEAPSLNVPEYPIAVEQQLIQALRHADSAEYLQELMCNFSGAIAAGCTYSFLSQCYKLLLLAALRALMEDGLESSELLEDNWFEQLDACHTTREVEGWFLHSVFPLFKQDRPSGGQGGGKEALAKVCMFVEENVGKPVSLMECAAHVGLNPSYLSRLFKKAKNQSLSDYIMQRKIAFIKLQLTSTDKSISDIAAEMGISARSLYRMFDRYTGMSPGAYRSAHR